MAEATSLPAARDGTPLLGIALLIAGVCLFAVTDATGLALPEAGLRRGNVAGSYMHLIDLAPEAA